jgi:hypothetical protein
MVYFEVDPDEQGKKLLLIDRRARRPLSLTPHYLATTVVPYIQALADTQKIIQEVRGRAVEDIQVQSIQLGKRPSQVRLALRMADEAIDIVRQWVGPWQHIYAEPPMTTADLNAKNLSPQLHDLVAAIADNLLISFSEQVSLSLREKLLSPISFIALSSLELTLEEPRP